MREKSGNAVVREDTIIKGQIRNGREIEVFGYLEGEVDAQQLIIRPGGKVYGKIKVDNVEIHGIFQGDAAVKNLIAIRATGSVSGNVRYGRLAMEDGANLTADVRNVPPDIAGDLDVTVGRGRLVRVTTMDLTAIDPDDSGDQLIYAVSNTAHGSIVLDATSKAPVANFTQADIEDGKVMFAHDGSDGPIASFDVVVTDSKGASSGPAKTVKVAVTS